ncbi:hypothetical protein [Erythrobacter litoralis]|uniref:DUF2834 domain-containing protein n=1 Tax=Erythrobacter litoralis (strain HTCC2594) TaxID=314225 RepID=Q2N988_ERYLH|nr:hypothetical protein [Erythrobacter litoralis]ABC63753.1 hypothetical protein ELI_08305 [Erythrobacter litoralis HTCC2594]
MDTFTLLFLIGAALVGPILIYIVVNREPTGSPLAAAGLSIAFALFTAFTIAREGVGQVIANHNLNYWGTQVWYDLLIAVSIALFFILPRARAAGMHVVPWTIFVALTASIGLLAMVARLFWLERHAARTA